MFAVQYVVFILVLISCSVDSQTEECTVDVCNEICITWQGRPFFRNGSNCRITCYRTCSGVNSRDCDSDINIMCRMIYVYCQQCTTKQDTTYPELSTITATTVVQRQENSKEDICNSSTATNAVIGLIVSAVLLIGIFLVIRHFIKMKSRKGSKSQPVSYVDDGVNRTTDKIHNMAISENSHVHKEIDSDSDSDYTILNNTTTETNRYEHTSYPCGSKEQSTPTVSAVESKDSSEYYTLPKEPVKSDFILKQNDSQSNYMFLVHNTSTATNTDPPAPQSKAAESEYSNATHPGESETSNTEVSKEDGTPKGDQDGGVNKQNILSLQNGGSYGNFRLVGNDSTEDSHDTLNRKACITGSVQDDVTADDNNKLIPTRAIPTPAFDDENYSHLNLTFLNLDESVTDPSHGYLDLSL
ncbi:uncharacterized protein LOC117099932 isoform X1 [Anneissia japonica]|uniref:uncharacterized protein LOC117099932 isoform X1 n=1 Tax=Anneissia japonica TaxID=1529436 RepID=UPI001425757E|nr:uncharacterized protein LOC117099932 isoform X1 [Anneissia japonica]